MKNETRELLAQYFNDQATLNGVASNIVAGEKQFTVEPSVQQKLESKIQESSAFLQTINIAGVDELQGEKIGMDIAGPLASRTNLKDPATKGRQTRDLTTLDDDGYALVETDFDSHVTYAKLDQWAKFPDFQKRISDLIVKRTALDRIMIGFNGVSTEVQSDFSAHPLLQDMNIGWLQKYRDHAGGKRVLTEGATAGKVRVGDGGDFENLNALAFNIVNEFIDPWFRKDPYLVAIMGSNLHADVNYSKINKRWDPTEELALEKILAGGKVGNIPVVTVPFVPDGTMFITHLKNLSIYYQNGANRRTFVDNAKFKRFETYSSSNEGYVVEDYGFGGVVENITLV